jgi:hypothetical protein
MVLINKDPCFGITFYCKLSEMSDKGTATEVIEKYVKQYINNEFRFHESRCSQDLRWLNAT